ncbi:MAG TPA: hypothetical protein VGW10_01575 [Solirubrobacteraceae bacterium]|nr:hypothetical protein [Solirubrobacteraceae bacterium]
MDPTFIYVSVVAIALSICTSAIAVGKGPTRSCPQCGDRVGIGNRLCRACRYRFQ